MKKQIIRMAGLAAVAILGLQLSTRAADTSAAPATPAAARSDANAQGGASDLNSRGNMSEKDFDAHWVMEAAQDNTLEIQVARLAETKSQDAQIKQFAQMLVKDHQQAGEQLKEIAQAKGIAWPAQLNEVGTAKVAELERKSGPGFDRHFIFGMVGNHACDVLKYRSGAELLTDPQLKQFAQQTLPTLKQHLHEAHRLANSDEAETAGAHIHGSGGGAADHTGAGNTGSGSGTGASGSGTGSSGTGSGTSGVNK